MFSPSMTVDSLKRKRGGNQEEIDEVSLFRRVRIYTNIHNLFGLTESTLFEGDYRATLYEHTNIDWYDCGKGFADIWIEREAGQQIPILFVKSGDGDLLFLRRLNYNMDL